MSSREHSLPWRSALHVKGRRVRGPRGTALHVTALPAAVVVVVVLVVGLLAAAPGSASPVVPARPSDTYLGPRHVLVRTAGTPGGPTVLVVGDSTTVQMIRPFAAALQARGLRATVDATVGRTTREGAAVVARYLPGDFDYVAVLLGANGRRANALRDMTVLRSLGVDTVATVQTPRRRLVNDAVRRVFGSQHIRWAGYAGRRGITPTDGKHYTARDYRIRARYLAAQIARRAT